MSINSEGMPMVYPKHVPLISPNCANRSDYVNLFKVQCYEPAAMKHVIIHLYNLYTDIYMGFCFLLCCIPNAKLRR